MYKEFKQAFSHYFPGTIWKMEINEHVELLALEWREKSSGNPRFAVIHYPSGHLITEGIVYGERWWTLAAITSKHLILQHYPEPSQAQTQGVVLINFVTGKIAFEWFNMQFQELSKEGIVVKSSSFRTNSLTLINEEGNILKNEITLQEVTPLERTLKTAVPSLVTPVIPLTSSSVIGPYFYLRYNDLDFWAFHEQTKKGYRLMLSIVKDQIPLVTEILNDHLEQLQPEVFFIIGQQLFFIRNNKQEFVSYFV